VLTAFVRKVLFVCLLACAGLLSIPAQSFAAAAAAPAVAPSDINLTSYANGAWILKKPAEYNETWSAFWLLDERAQTGWATPNGSVGPQEVLIALAEESVIKTLEFDNASADGDSEGSRTAKDIVVQVSNQSPTAGFETIATVVLKARQDKQKFSVSKTIPARWVKLTIKSNHSSTEYIELFDFRAFGEQKTKTPMTNVSGTYATNYGNFHLQQEGASVSGCYEHGKGLVVNGGLEGRVTRFTWTQEGTGRGPAIFTFSPDGKEVLGIWWYDGQTDGPGELWYGKKTSDAIGSCPHWKGVQTASSQLAKDIGETGRARIYGINFDTDSDVIKPESKPALDNIVKLAKEKADWKFTIEGHTDSTATAAHNQTLSEKRAASVKTYLVAAGVAASRVTPQGFGATKPVGDNSTSLGRAQNRRVELVKN
jgi:outer membrane protein OmpA-like peptidoglycan-associated protein